MRCVWRSAWAPKPCRLAVVVVRRYIYEAFMSGKTGQKSAVVVLCQYLVYDFHIAKAVRLQKVRLTALEEVCVCAPGYLSTT